MRRTYQGAIAEKKALEYFQSLEEGWQAVDKCVGCLHFNEDRLVNQVDLVNTITGQTVEVKSYKEYNGFITYQLYYHDREGFWNRFAHNPTYLVDYDINTGKLFIFDKQYVDEHLGEITKSRWGKYKYAYPVDVRGAFKVQL